MNLPWQNSRRCCATCAPSFRLPRAKPNGSPALLGAPIRQRGTLFVTRCASVVTAFLLAALPARAQETIVTLNPAQTHIAFTLGATFHTVHGTFRLKSGEVRFDVGSGKASGKIVVDATSGESGNDSRDKKMHRDYLESQKFPEIVFTPTQVKGTLNPGATSQVEVIGTFRLHGADHEFTLNVNVQPGTEKVECETKFTIPYVQWGIKNPSTFFLRVSDKVDIEIQAGGKLTPAPQL